MTPFCGSIKHKQLADKLNATAMAMAPVAATACY